jgi:hypothetical protein
VTAEDLLRAIGHIEQAADLSNAARTDAESIDQRFAVLADAIGNLATAIAILARAVAAGGRN